MIISHAASGLVYDFECAPDETFMVQPEKGLLVHANHWLSPIALAKLQECGMADAPSTFYRELRAREALAAKAGDVTLDDVMAVMLDDFETPRGRSVIHLGPPVRQTRLPTPPWPP